MNNLLPVAVVSAVLILVSCKKEEKDEVVIPGVPTLQTPVNGATSVSVFPTFTWNGVSGATSYEVQVSSSGGTFAGSDLEDQGIVYGSTSYKNNSNQYSSGVYFWRVRAINSAGTGNWSASYTFSVDNNSPDQPGPVFGKLLIYEPNLPSGISYAVQMNGWSDKIISCAGSIPANCDVPDSCTFARYTGIYSQYLNITVRYANGPNEGQIVNQGTVSGSLGMCERIKVSDL